MVDQGSGVAADVRGDRVHVAALPLAAASGVQAGVGEARIHIDAGAHLVPEQRQPGVRDRERGVERDGGGHGRQRTLTQSEDVEQSARVGLGGFRAGGEGVPVRGHDTACKTE